MKSLSILLAFSGLATLVAVFGVGCRRSADKTEIAPVPKHEHHPPHGGTAVVLGAEAYHLELVRDATTGALQVYVLDGEMEDFIRISAPSMIIDAVVNNAPQLLGLRPVATTATGETVGDTALFEGQAEWLKTAGNFDATLRSITIRGTTFTDVKFNFPQGNDHE